MEPDLMVYYPGTKVWLLTPDEQLDAIVIATLIETGPQVTYKVAWWAGNDRKEQWVIDDEIRLPLKSPIDKVKIGFNNA
jgi:hypothetical protein